MRNRYLAVLFIIVFFTGQAAATTVVYVVTPTGIVVGADGKATPTGTVLKIVLLRGKYIVADLYVEHAKSDDSGIVRYDFPSWVKKIEEQTDAKVSVSGLTETIKNQMTTTFAFAIDAIKIGQLTREQAATVGADAYLIQYVIAGYDEGIPFVHSLTLMPDWNAKTVNGPFDVPLKEKKGERRDSYIGWRGQGVALCQISTTDTEEQKELASKIPVEFSTMRNGNDLTLHQASNVVRAMLGIESKANPKFVGFPITVVTAPQIGRGWTRTYKRDVAALSSLPKTIQPKKPR